MPSQAAFVTASRFSPDIAPGPQAREAAIARRIERAQRERRLRWFWTGRKEPPEPALIVLRDSAGWDADELRGLQRWWGRQESHAQCRCAPEILVLKPDAGLRAIGRVTLCGGARAGAILRAVLGGASAAARPADRAGSDEWLILTATPGDYCEWARNGTACFSDGLVDRLIGELWGGNRPVLAWRSHFFQILRYRDLHGEIKYCERKFEPEYAEREEHAYFLSHLQPLVAPLRGSDKAQAWLNDTRLLRSFTARREWLYMPAQEGRPSRCRFRFRLERQTDFAPAVTLGMTALRVHFFHDELIALEWEIGQGPKIANLGEFARRPVWSRIFDRDFYTALSLAQVIEANARIRQCYSPFKGMRESPQERTTVDLTIEETGKEPAAHRLAHGEEVSPGPMDGWFRELVKMAVAPFGIGFNDLDGQFSDTEAKRSRYGLVTDDRARLVSSLVMEGANAPQTAQGGERFEQLRARLHTADPYGSGYYYDAAFSRRELKKGAYDRFAGCFYTVSSHSFVYCGFAGHSRFALEEIHGKHMRLHYRRLFLLALFYQASLDTFARDLAKVTRDYRIRDSRFRKQLEPLRDRFIFFVNGLWFDEVTPQIQGIELFDKMRERLRLRPIYTEIKQEVENSDNYQREIALARLSALATWASFVALLVAVAAVIFGLLALGLQFIDVLEPKIKDTGPSELRLDWLKSIGEWPPKALDRFTRYVASHTWVPVLFSVSVLIVMPLLLLLWRRRWTLRRWVRRVWNKRRG